MTVPQTRVISSVSARRLVPGKVHSVQLITANVHLTPSQCALLRQQFLYSLDIRFTSRQEQTLILKNICKLKEEAERKQEAKRTTLTLLTIIDTGTLSLKSYTPPLKLSRIS